MQLATDRLILRELVADDWRALLAIESKPEVVRYTTKGVATEQAMREYVQSGIRQSRELPRMVIDLAMTERGDDTLIGRCGMRRDAGELRNAMVWFLVSPEHADKGYATEAVTALLAYAFDELHLHRVWGDCDPRNPASGRVMEKVGMRREGHLVENVWLKGEWCDSVLYGILEREWAARAGPG